MLQIFKDYIILVVNFISIAFEIHLKKISEILNLPLYLLKI